DPNDEAQVDAVASIPLGSIDHDVLGFFFAREYGREQDPVVIRMRFLTEHRHLEARRERKDLLEAGHARHAVADDNEPLHRAVLSPRTAACLSFGSRETGSQT